MTAAQIQNLFGRPSHKVTRDAAGGYSSPPGNATAQNPAVETESGNIVTDETGTGLAAN